MRQPWRRSLANREKSQNCKEKGRWELEKPALVHSSLLFQRKSKQTEFGCLFLHLVLWTAGKKKVRRQTAHSAELPPFPICLPPPLLQAMYHGRSYPLRWKFTCEGGCTRAHIHIWKQRKYRKPKIYNMRERKAECFLLLFFSAYIGACDSFASNCPLAFSVFPPLLLTTAFRERF